MTPNFRLGRKAVKRDTRTLFLRRYLPALPSAPATFDLTAGLQDWNMFGNDSSGDCTCAGVGHQDMLWTLGVAGTPAPITDADVLGIYEKWCGYDPSQTQPDGSNPTDEGGVELDILTDWRKQTFAGHQLTGFAAVNVADTSEVRAATWLFGGLYIGMNVPQSMMDQAGDPSKVLDVVADDGGIVGGHCVVICGVPETDLWEFISWGTVYRMTEAFRAKYVDESYALFSPDWIGAKGSPEGFNADQLAQDLAQIR